MTSLISFAFVLTAALLAVAYAFPSEKLRYNGALKGLPSLTNQQGPKGLIPQGPQGLLPPRRERSAPGKDLSTSESYGFGYGGWGGWGGYGGWGGWGDWGWGGWGYPYSYGYWGYPYGYGGYGGYGGYYGGWYPYSYDWWWF